MVDKVYKNYILISGGAGFLGQQYANYLLQKNFSVIILDKNITSIKKSKFFYKKKILFLKADITSETQIKKIYSFLQKKKIHIDILINNAAIDSIPKKNSNNEINVKQLKKEIDVSLIGTCLLIKYFSAKMIKQRYGKILNIGSDLSVIAPNQKLYKGLFKGFKKPVSYSMIKHAMLGITKYYAALFGEFNICVNMLSPGPVYNNHNKFFVKRLKEIIPLNRMAEPKDLFSALDFLIDDKNNYITGQNIIIDGGRTII